jgi:hypothetical protein
MINNDPASKKKEAHRRMQALANIVGMNINKTPSTQEIMKTFDLLPEETKKIILQEVTDYEQKNSSSDSKQKG